VKSVKRFVDAIIENMSTESEHIASVTLREDTIASLLDRHHLNQVFLNGVHLEDIDRNMPRFTVALKRNNSLTSLGLQCLPTGYIESCLNALVD